MEALARRRLGVVIGVETISAEDAARITTTGNSRNRNVRGYWVAHLRRKMLAGEFNPRLSGPLKFYADGTLADGQHRLLAQVGTGLSFSYDVLRGLSADDGKVLDIGPRRTSADRLQIDGVLNGKTKAALMRAVFECGNTAPITSSEIEEAVLMYDAELSPFAIAAGKRSTLIFGVFFGAAYGEGLLEQSLAVMRRFIDRIRTGPTDPLSALDELELRVGHSRGKDGRGHMYRLAASCVKAALEGRELTMVKQTKGWPKSPPMN